MDSEVLMNTRVLMGILSASTMSLASAAGVQGVDAVSDQCSAGGDREQVECLSQQVDRLNGELDRAYRRALDKLPEQDANDKRGSRDQLRQSETAWLQYEQANCPLMGAMEGGSNLWITHFSLICEEQEIQTRTKLLKQIADGSLGGR